MEGLIFRSAIMFALSIVLDILDKKGKNHELYF